MSDVPVPRIAADSPPTPMNWLRDHAQAAPRGHWDELRNRLSDASQEAHPPGRLWTKVIDHLGPDGLSGLSPRMASLRRQVRDNGITYNIYAQADQPQRPWALDLFPLLISAEAWEQVEQGVRQRMQLLEHIMADA
ncbi:MAG: A circularly permuted ATPgrasp family protein, partial [Limnohabitans sp.]